MNPERVIFQIGVAAHFSETPFHYKNHRSHQGDSKEMPVSELATTPFPIDADHVKVAWARYWGGVS